MRWEYKAIAIGFSGTTQLEAELNDMGKDGWELVCAPSGDEPEEDGLFYANCIFKRPVGGVRFVTVEGESGETYRHYHSDPTLTRLAEYTWEEIEGRISDRLSSFIRLAATQQRGRGKPGAQT